MDIPLLREQAKTLTATQLADLYNMPRSTMCDRLDRLGIATSGKKYNRKDDYNDLPDLVQAMTVRELMDRFGVNRSTMVTALRRRGLNALPDTSSEKRYSDRYTDLAERAKTMTRAQLAGHYGVTYATMDAALKRRSIRPPKAQPADNYPALAVICPSMNVRQLAAHYGVTEKAIRCALIKRGLSPLRMIAPKREKPKPKARPALLSPRLRTQFHTAGVTDHRAKKTADLAQEFLQKECAVFRCTETGQPDQKGKFYKRGSRILTPDELIAMATRKGWKPESWKALAA